MEINSELYSLMGCVFLIAGIVQGLFGMGLPAIGITLLSVFIPPMPAIGLNIIPILLISLFQIFQTKNPFNTVIKYKLFATLMVIVGFFTSFLVIFLGDALLLTILASVVIIFSLNNIFRKRLTLSIKLDFYWQILFGSLAGFVGGLTSIMGVIGVMYLAMKDLKPNEFVAANGFLIFIGCLSVGLGYMLSGVIQPYMIGPSLFGTVTAFIGFKIGSNLRKFLSSENFYKALWILFLLAGLRLALTAISKF